MLNENLQRNGIFLKPIDKKQHIQDQCVNVLIMFFFNFLKFKLEYNRYGYQRVQIL